jgi:histidine biosynthesis protein
VRELCARFPELELLAGGGVRDVADLRALADAGAAGALLATALHGGAIGPGELSALEERGGRQPTTVSRCSASAAATSTPVARSTPCQPGMPLTSST